MPVSPAPSEWPRRRWVFANPAPAAVEELVRTHGLPRHLASALAARGVSPDAAPAWLAPRLDGLVPPDRFPGILPAADRIRAAVRDGGEIAVFGDFDADGICATAILCSAIEAIGGRVHPFIPDRAAEGYGFTEAAVSRLLREHSDVRLVVTVDCGITQKAGCDLCREAGVDVVITDHHTTDPDKPFPEVLAIVHPALLGVPEEVRHLAGAGVAFKLAHALSRGTNGSRLFDPRALLPLAALATVADIVPLVGENRLLVANGLALLNRGECPGIQALRQAARINRPLRAVDFGYRIGPRINAAGRIGNPMDAYRLLRATSEKEAAPLAQALDALNAERQRRERDATDEAFADLVLRLEPTSRSAVVLSETWDPGVIGLVAGRLCQRLGLPAIAFRIDTGTGIARGSARCPERPGLDLMDLLRACSDEIIQFGGHSAAGGLSVSLDRLDAFRDAFESVCAVSLPEPVRPDLSIDAWIDPGQVDAAFHESLARIEPIGAGNPAPRWAFRGAVLQDNPAPFGRDGQFRRLLVRREGGTPLEAVLFHDGDIPMPWRAGDHVDIVFTTEISDFAGGSLRLLVDDLREGTA